MPDRMIVHKTAEYGGGQTSSMPQKTVQKYLGNLVEGTRLTNLSQALNQTFNGQGKATGSLSFDGHPVLHASAGKVGVSSVTLFYYEARDAYHLFAMGEHKGSASYSISYFGPSSGTFKSQGTVSIR